MQEAIARHEQLINYRITIRLRKYRVAYRRYRGFQHVQ